MLLSETEKQAVAKAVKRAELTTSGEIVFVITNRSGNYHHATLLGALIGAFVAVAICLALPIPQSIGLVLWTEIVAFAFFYALLPHLPQRRWLIPGREMNESVHDAAFREFYARGLYKTRASNGVLIYLSNLERRVVVLGDKGIHERMGDHHWNDVRDRIIQGIKQGQASRGICDAIELCGKALAEHFPRLPDDTNELPDDVIERRRD
jgi:putative membrane protein